MFDFWENAYIIIIFFLNTLLKMPIKILPRFSFLTRALNSSEAMKFPVSDLWNLWMVVDRKVPHIKCQYLSEL